MINLAIRGIFLGAIIGVTIAVSSQAALRAEAVTASPLTGSGDYEFLFFSADRKPEIDALTARFRELDPELKNLHTELDKTQAEIAALTAKRPNTKSQRLEWSPIEGVVGYSVKLFDAQKKLLETKNTQENFLVLELEPAEYHFQVAAVTQYKTGTYSRLTMLKVSNAKPDAAQLALSERAETLREKIKVQRSIRGEYLKTLRARAVGNGSAADARADLKVPADAAIYLAINKKTEPYAMSAISILPGRDLKPAAIPVSIATSPEGTFRWGAGGMLGVQDTRLDFFRVAFGAEGLLRYEKPFFRFFYPQLKMMATYSGAKTAVYDAMLFVNLYSGVYYPVPIGKGFSFLFSLSTGPNLFLILSSAASASVLQWGVMPAVEVQYALGERTSLYLSGAINFTFDPQGEILKFIPLSLGVTRRF